MRTYEIIDQAGTVLRRETVDDTIRPVMRDGEEARLTHVDGEPAIQGEELQLSDDERARLPKLAPLDADRPAEYAVGITGTGTRPDDALPSVQIAPPEGAEPIAAAAAMAPPPEPHAE